MNASGATALSNPVKEEQDPGLLEGVVGAGLGALGGAVAGVAGTVASTVGGALAGGAGGLAMGGK